MIARSPRQLASVARDAVAPDAGGDRRHKLRPLDADHNRETVRSQFAFPGRDQEAIGYDEIVAGLIQPSEPAGCQHAARALFNKGVGLGARGHGDDAISVYDEILTRFADAPQPSLRQLVAATLIFKGVTLGVLGRGEEAIDAYDEVVERFADDPHPALRVKVARARGYKRMRLGLTIGHSARPAASRRQAVTRANLPVSVDPPQALGLRHLASSSGRG
jgi:tetratricopeptide (TPR) repeat protein